MMEKNKDILIVIIATLIFGGASKILVGVPYMAWGYFDQLFIAAFILWTFYSAALYVAIKIENRKNENYLKIGFVGVMFGLAVACLKMASSAAVSICPPPPSTTCCIRPLAGRSLPTSTARR